MSWLLVVNVVQVPQHNPLRYPGIRGQGLADLILHTRAWGQARPMLLVKPFCGGGIVSLTTVMEDLDPDVVAF